MKSALITGVTGQDGAYLSKFLLSKGYEVHECKTESEARSIGYKVYGTYRRTSSPNFWRLCHLKIFEQVELIPADVTDMSSILEAINVSQPGEIYNLSDDYPCSNIEIANYAYEMMKVSKPKMIEINEIKNEMLRNFYKDSKKVCNKKIKEVFSYKLKFPTYKKGLSRIYDHFI